MESIELKEILEKIVESGKEVCEVNKMEQDFKWLIISSNTITVGNNFDTVYMSDFKYFGTRKEAILHGLEVLKHDDFNIIQICNKKVLSMWWMDKEINKDYKEVYKEIEKQLFCE